MPPSAADPPVPGGEGAPGSGEARAAAPDGDGDARSDLDTSIPPAKPSGSQAAGAPGAPADDKDKIELAEPAARFEAAGYIGEGGTAEIRRHFDKNLLRYVAEKKLLEALAHRGDIARLLLEEARITGQLEHPNVVPIYDLGLDERGLPRFAMKVIEGRTLTALLAVSDLKRRSSRDLQVFLKVLVKVCEAMSYAHSRGVIHRDLKPDNVMVGSHGQVYVMDWGCARVLNAPGGVTLGDRPERGTLDAPGFVVGTGAYMPPEQAYGLIAEIDERTDVFSLGAILYEILTGRPPYRGATQEESILMAQRAQLVPPEELAPPGRVPAGLSQIAMKAMSPVKADRQASAEAFKEELERFLAGGFWFAQRTYRPRTVLFRQGDPADAAYIITSGTAGAYKLEGGARVLLRKMGPGDVFGESALLDGQRRTADVVAIDELTVMIVTRDTLENELSRESWIGAFVRKLAERFRDLDAEITKLREAGPR